MFFDCVTIISNKADDVSEALQQHGRGTARHGHEHAKPEGKEKEERREEERYP
jgi:hypothetical protein